MDSKNNNNDLNAEDNETKNFIQNKFSLRQSPNKNQIKKQRKLSINIFIIICIIIFIFVFIQIKNNKMGFIMKFEKNIAIPSTKPKEIFINKTKDNINKYIYPYSTKWVVLTTINSPNENLKHLLDVLKSWKFVIIGDLKTNNDSWKIYNNSTKLFYLSLEEQIKLNYKTTKYIPLNSYTRKNIGYLYAIQHGAKEIYETDDDIFLFNNNSLYLNISKYLFYAENNISVMVNPYSFYGKSTIWPRGFRLKDIDKKSDRKFYRLLSQRANLNHLIFQGLMNINPDVDSIFRQSRTKKNTKANLKFFYAGSLMYLPGNFIPINSKNARYFYDVFPSLALPTTVSRRISDIWRGYIMQRYSWIFNGTVVFHVSSADHKKNFSNYNITSDFIEERDLFYKLDILLDSLNVDVDKKIKNPSEFLINLIEILIDKKLLKDSDLLMNKAFIEDLNSFGFNYNLNFDKTIEHDEKKLLNLYSELNFYFARQNKILLQNNNNKSVKLFKHKSANIIYNDILLIINYNYVFLTKLNDYMVKLYNEYFPDMVFMYPGEIKNNKTYVSCPESHNGYYSYICIKKVYELYPNKKGYLFLMDDDFLKVWELENFDFNIPWFYHFFVRNDKFYRKSYKKAKTILDIHLDWKRRYIKFLGSGIVAYAVSDIYYLPQQDIGNFCKMVEEFYKRKVFLETAVPTIMGIMMKPKYQIIQFAGLWGDHRNKTLSYLRTAERQVTIHPIKFSNLQYQEEVMKYIFLMNAKDY